MKEEKDPTIVDRYSLDTEWEIQPNLRMHAGSDQAEVADEIRDKKAYLKFRTAQISFEYNTGHRKIKDEAGEDVKKPTVGTLKSAVESNEELYKLEKEINKLQKKLDICASYTVAIDQKKYALQDEVKLYQGGYYSTPTVPNNEGGRDYKKEMEAITEKSEESDAREKVQARRKKKVEDE